MKAMLSSLLVAAVLALSASPLHAQRVVATSYSSGYGHGYVSSRVWIPGRYENIHQRVWVPGCSERVWVEPVFELRRDHCGNRFRVLVRAGHWTTVHHPGHYETRTVRVWQPGHWAPRGYCG